MTGGLTGWHHTGFEEAGKHLRSEGYLKAPLASYPCASFKPRPSIPCYASDRIGDVRVWWIEALGGVNRRLESGLTHTDRSDGGTSAPGPVCHV